MITTPENVHTAIATATSTAATLLAQRTEPPPLSTIEIGYDHSNDRACIRCQLGPTTTPQLPALTAWADTLNEPTVTARRVTHHTAPFTSVSVLATLDSTDLQIWAHPDNDETTALWHATGHEPNPDTTTPITIEALRAAATNAQPHAA